MGTAALLDWWANIATRPVGTLWIPPRVQSVRLADGGAAIGWWPAPPGTGFEAAWRSWRAVAPDTAVVRRFLALSGLAGSADEVASLLAFVHDYGPLGVVGGTLRPEVVSPSQWLPEPVEPGLQPPVVEPIAAYRRLAARMGAVLRVLTACAQPDSARRLQRHVDDLVRLLEDSGVAVTLTEFGVTDISASLTAQAEWLAERPEVAQELALNHVTVLLAQARPALDLRLRRIQPQPFSADWPSGVELWSVGLFPLLAVQLAAMVVDLPRRALCDGCGRLYTPRRRPRAGEAHYCPSCGKGGGYRVAKRRWWREHRTQKQG